ncbi:MAG TPA: AsmA family protein [Burkholderiales bacterium]
MKKLIKWGLWTAAIVGVPAVAGAVYLALTFDPNRYKDELERLVKDETGRTLQLRGKLELTFFPSVGAKVAGLSLSERFSEQEFLSLESAHASVKVMPLLRGHVVVDAVRVTGLKARVVQGKTGRFNFDDLLGGAESKSAAPEAPKAKEKTATPPAKGGGSGPVEFQVSSVRLERSSIDYRDLAADSEIALADVRITTGRIAGKAGGKLTMSAAAKGRNPDADVKFDLRSDYQLDLPQSIALQKLDAKLAGAAAGMTGLELSAEGEAGFDLPKNQVRIGALSIAFKGANGADALEGTLKLANARLSERTLDLPKLSTDITLTSAGLPAPIRPLKLPLSGSVKANFEKQTASAELAGKIDESTINARIGLARFTPPSYSFDIDFDRLNLDRYLEPQKPAAAPASSAKIPPPPASSKPEPGKPAAKSAETSVDLSPLKGLNGAGKVRIGALQVRGLRLSEVKAEMRAAAGRVDVAPHSARLYDGAVAGDLTLDANGNRVALKETLSDVTIGALLKDVAGKDYVEGKGNVTLDVSAAGATVEAMKRALGGTAKVNLREGVLKGFDAAGILRQAQSIVGAQTAHASGKEERTEFGTLVASFKIADGVARNDDLDVQAPGLRIVGSGIIDLGRSRLDYRAIPRLVTNKEGRGIEAPVHLTGAFDDIEYEVNYGQVLRDTVRNTGRQLRDGVKRLLGQ